MNKKQPEIRFFGFEDDWKSYKLMELFTKGGSGGTPKSTNVSYYNGSIPFLGITDISNSNGYVYDTEKHISEEGLKNSTAWIVPAGSVSLAMYASVGKLAILKTDAATSQAFYNMVFDDNILRDFTYQRLVKSKEFSEWTKLISTGTQANLNAEKVKNLEVNIPLNKSEMNQIANFFKNIDKFITFHQQELTTLKQTKQGFLQKMFPKEGEKVPEVRFPCFTDDWEQRKLADLAEYYDGTHQTPKYTKSGVPFVSVENIHNIKRTDKYISEEDFENQFKIKPKKDDILMTRITAGVIGDTTIVPDNNSLAYYVSLALIRPKKIMASYLEKYIGSNQFKEELHKRIIHTAFPKKINLGEIGQCIVSCPCNDSEQEKIGSFFKQLDKTITLHQRELELLQLTKKAFSQKLFV